MGAPRARSLSPAWLLAFAGLLGYVMGRAKFSRRSAPMRALLVILGLLAAAAFNGLFSVIETFFATGSTANQRWYGVAYAASFASAVFVVIWFASQNVLASSPFRRDQT